MSSEEESESVTAVVTIGEGVFFQPSIEAFSATVTHRQELLTCLDSRMIDKANIDTLHMIMQTKSMSALYDPDALQTILPSIRSNAEIFIHVLGNPGEEDVDTVKMSLVLASCRIEAVQDGEGGSKIVVARLVK
jgi:hypothetical protein